MLPIKLFLTGQVFPVISLLEKSTVAKRTSDVNFCRTFILSILLCLELAGSNLAQTLLNPSKVIWHHLFLTGEV